jgi:lantibiotic biosynthesis dehydratase-like protein
MGDCMALAGDWELWRDFAVRSAGFPVEGLQAFGPGDESGRLAAVAAEPAFGEAVTWQNRAAYANAVAKVALRSPTKPSRARQREEVVASYWQRYCAKNDTIGFFGPLAWGRFADDGPALAVRSDALVARRDVHFEAWAVQALAAAVDPDLRIAAGPHTEHELRTALEAHADDAVRSRGLDALAALEAARDGVAEASRESLETALAHLDTVFVELTGRDPTRNPGMAYGARTLCYLDCLRDLDVTIGPALVETLAPPLQVLFEAGRWYSGRVCAIGRRVIEAALPGDGRAPFAPVLRQVVRALFETPPQLYDEVAELHRRLGQVLVDPDQRTAGTRAAAVFADYQPAWRPGVFSSVDVQIAAADEAAVDRGDYLAVIGDIHLGGNPLVQGVFAHRHPHRPAFFSDFVNAVGKGLPVLLPPWAPTMGVESRGLPATTKDMVHIAVLPDTRAPAGRRTWLPDELLVEGMDLVDRRGELRIPLIDVFWLPIFVSGVRLLALLPEAEHAPRVTIGRTVLRREGWRIAPADIPERAEDVARFAYERGMPRRVFTKSPLERKPMYLDVESPVLCRILCRQARQAAAAPAAEPLTFTEMLPRPEDCWLADANGGRYVTELRIVAEDRSPLRRHAGDL